jgi:acyl-CoA thioester hydrolase
MEPRKSYHEGEMRETSVRVRFAETDAMGIVWHGNYFEYFEMGRLEWLRSIGMLDEFKAQKLRMTVVHGTVDYERPARFDDLLTLRTTLIQVAKVRIRFRHEILRDAELLATGTVDVVCLDAEGRVRRVPEELLSLKGD